MKRGGPLRKARIRQLRRGEAIPAGEPKRYPNQHGYVRLRWLVGTQQYVEVYEHRVIDGIVTEAEHVHHDNRIKDDNQGVNLVPLTAEEHNRLHAEERKGKRLYGPYRSKQAKEKAERVHARRAERRARAETMRSLYLDEHLSTTEIAARVGLHHSAVSRELRSIGVRLRSPAVRTSSTGPTPAARQAVTSRACLRCERCGGSVKWQPMHVHHRKPRGMGGSSDPAINSPANLLLLCVPCHTAVESDRTTAYEQGWLVHRDHDPARVPVWIYAREFVLLTNHGTYENEEAA